MGAAGSSVHPRVEGDPGEGAASKQGEDEGRSGRSATSCQAWRQVRQALSPSIAPLRLCAIACQKPPLDLHQVLGGESSFRFADEGES